MTIIEQLESWFDCGNEETQADGDGISNVEGKLKIAIGNLPVGTKFSSYFYDPYSGELKIYGDEQAPIEPMGRGIPQVILCVQCNLVLI